MNPFHLQWGSATPEFYSADTLTAIHAINHALRDQDQLVLNLDFIRGRIAFFSRHLPSGATQRIIFDDRGQDIPSAIREEFRTYAQSIAMFEYLSEGIQDGD